MAVSCYGTGSPTLVVLTGLTAPAADWDSIARQAGATTRTCVVDRPGVGMSEVRDARGPTSVGDVTREIRQALAAAHADPPYVLVAHSFGGLVARLFVAEKPQDVVGVVFVDASTSDQLVSPAFTDGTWTEAGTSYDMVTTLKQLKAAPSLGSVPVVVLTQDASGDFKTVWFPIQDKLATVSRDTVHVVAIGASHIIQEDKPEIVLAAIDQVVMAARSGMPLGPCASVYPKVGGVCR